VSFFLNEDKNIRPFGSNTLTPLSTPVKDTMLRNIFAFLALLAVTAAEGQYHPCVTTNAANGNCTALTDANIRYAVSDTIGDPSSALAEWGDISDW